MYYFSLCTIVIYHFIQPLIDAFQDIQIILGCVLW
jgi:hypothetical protein